MENAFKIFIFYEHLLGKQTAKYDYLLIGRKILIYKKQYLTI